MYPFIIHIHKCFAGVFKAGTFSANTEKALTFDVKTKVKAGMTYRQLITLSLIPVGSLDLLSIHLL